MSHQRPFWRTALLQAALVGGSIVFALPYVWLVGTSWKLDKEIQSEDIHLLAQRPIPRQHSPYVDHRTFQLKAPADADPAAWDRWMRVAVEDEIGRAIDAWNDDRARHVDPAALRAQLTAGVFRRLRGLLTAETWSHDETRLRAALRAAVRPQHVAEAFEQCYRYFALGKVLLKDRHYRIHDLTGRRPIEQLWTVGHGPVTIEPRVEAQRPVAVLHYDWRDGDAFEVSADLPLPVPWTEMKRIEVSFRRDQTWHEMRALVEVNGRLYRSQSPKYLGEDTWWDVAFQEPGPDDRALTPRRYVLIRPSAEGPQYDHGPDVMRLRIELSRSSALEALWAKGTENYRKVFEEVPFWRYLSTSAFLALANIVGTLLSCSLAAYALARLQWPGRELCFTLVLATLMIPPQVTMIPSFVIYRSLGWYNTLAPLWVPSCFATNAFAIFLMRQAMKGIPRDLEDAARIDGCGYLRTYWHVAMPLMRPTMAVIGIFTFMYVWNDFMGPLIYVNDQRLYPLALGLFSFLAGRESQFTLIMAGAMVMTAPVIVTFFLAQRYFIQGVTLTGVKG